MGDGRAYSQARVLRERYAYLPGEIRAQGDVLRDQLFHMSRCGINAFELRARPGCAGLPARVFRLRLLWPTSAWRADGIETGVAETRAACLPEATPAASSGPD